MAESRHNSAASRARVSSNSSSYPPDRDSAADYRDYERDHARDSHYTKDRERLREGERYRDREKIRDSRDKSWQGPPAGADPIAAPSRVSEKTRVPEKVRASDRIRVSGSSSDDSLYSASSLSGQDDHSFEGNDTEREPGELSSGSMPEDAAAAVEGAMPGKSSKTSSKLVLQHHAISVATDAEGGCGGSSSPVLKKRKFTPIVWDLDDRHPHKGSGVVGGSSSSSTAVSSLKTSPATKSQSRPLLGAAVPSPPLPPPPSGLTSSPPLPPPPPLPFPLKQQTPHRTPPANAARETPPKSSTRPSATPPSAASHASVARALAMSGPKQAPVGSSGSRKSTSRGSYTPSPSSPDRPQFSPPGTDSNLERAQRDAYVRNASSRSSDESEQGQLLASPMQDDEADTAPPPRINIAASRWAEESTSPSEGKLPFVTGKTKIQQSLNTESVEAGHFSPDEEGGRDSSAHSMSPEPGEYIKDKSEIISGTASGSNAVKDYDDRMGDQYERDLNDRELMDLDEDADHDSEEEHPEVESDEEELLPAPTAPPLRTINMLQGCRSVDEFERLNKIDEGTYGVVYRARNKKTGEIVALKKVKMEKEREGFPMTSLREINVLLSIHHPSIVDVKEVVVGSNLDSIFMVMEYMEHDLKGLMETIKQPFSQSEVKCLMLQLFEGVKHLHDNWVLHRDLKTSNLLLNNRGELKICDFGLARQYGSPLKTYTHMVVTLWYRAPELLLGGKQYSTAVDMWSLGCIMAEFLAKEPLFNGKNELDQLDKIFKTLGTPNETIWPDFSKLPTLKCSFVKQPFNRLREKFPPTAFAGRPPLSESGFNLLNRLLLYDPKKRITAEEALKHEWFKEVPLPKMKELMPTYPARSEQERRLRRLMKSPDPLAEQRKRELRQAELGGGGLFG